MILTKEQKGLLLDFCSGEISKSELVDRYPDDLSDEDHLKKLYSKVLEAESGKDLEYAVMLEPIFFNSVESREKYYVQFAHSDWHRIHEPLALVFLERIASDNCVEAIYHIATSSLSYLSDEDNESLSVQCTYALSNVETPKSVEKLQLLAQSDNDLIRSEATQRLQELEEIV